MRNAAEHDPAVGRALDAIAVEKSSSEIRV